MYCSNQKSGLNPSQYISIDTRAITHFKRNGGIDIAAEIKAEIECDFARVIDYNIVNNVMYAVLSCNAFDTTLGIYYAVTMVEIVAFEIDEHAAIIRMVKYAETHNPPYTDCALRVLKLLPALDSNKLSAEKYQNALNWRRACLAKRRKK